jgi:tetratricopeptide (TPR) repeat protein
VRGVLIAIALVAAFVLGALQIGSDAIFAHAGEPASLPAHLPSQLGTAIYRRAARVAQPAFVNSMLARAALDRGDLTQAQTDAQRLPDSARRDELLGQIALARGDQGAAQRYFVRAGDIEAIDRVVDALAPRHPAAAYRLQAQLKDRLQQSGTHPDAVAEAYWRMGRIAWQESRRELGMQQYMQAISLSPLSEKYLISGGFAAYELHDDARALRYFSRALNVDPASADAYAGAGMALLRRGDRAGALRYAQRARATQRPSHALLTLEKQLHE